VLRLDGGRVEGFTRLRSRSSGRVEITVGSNIPYIPDGQYMDTIIVQHILISIVHHRFSSRSPGGLVEDDPLPYVFLIRSEREFLMEHDVSLSLPVVSECRVEDDRGLKVVGAASQ